MTATASAGTSARIRLALPAGVDDGRWRGWLTARLEPGWRAKEWDADLWLFTGDPSNDFTASQTCATPHCGVRTDGTTLCSPCQYALRRSGQTRAEFLTTHDPTRLRTRPNTAHGRCAVRRGDASCVRPAHCNGLCAAHYALFSYYRRTHQCTLEAWLPRGEPFAQPPRSCLVLGCDMDVVGRQDLCQYHYRRHRLSGAQGSPREWAATATPYLRAGQFTLRHLHPTVRVEMLYALQCRAARGGVIQPKAVRLVVTTVAERHHMVGVRADELAGDTWTRSPEIAVTLKEVTRWLTEANELMTGVDAHARTVWDLRQLNLHANTGVTAARRTEGTVDFGAITQDWLRRITMQACATFSTSRKVLHTVSVATTVSSALERLPRGGHDVTQLGGAHLDTITAAFRDLRDKDGIPRRAGYRYQSLRTVWTLLDFGRRAGLLNAAPSTFTPDPQRHRMAGAGARVDDSDEVGKAIPELVIAQLDQHLHLLRCPVIYRGWSEQQMQLMFHTLYIVVRDTGRRPRKACSLRTDCLEQAADGTLLIWDNHKSRRLQRRLPITEQTAQAIRAWRDVRGQLTTGDARDGFLFPARTLGVPDRYFMPANLGDGLRCWIRRIPELLSDAVDSTGTRIPFDRTRIYPYAFRHSYAQRHADAGVAIDVLRDLMDHKHIATTQGYYRVTAKRKREAIRSLRLEVVDRTGAAAAAPSPAAYELRSVAAPFGNCLEPANVKAGGGACPIRFQCSGCGYYRADPSYIPAIEDHVQALRADRERAAAMNVDPFVLRNLSDQIQAYQHVLESMRDRLAAAGDDERHEIEDAAAVLRKLRAGRTALPITPAAGAAR